MMKMKIEMKTLDLNLNLERAEPFRFMESDFKQTKIVKVDTDTLHFWLKYKTLLFSQ